MATEPANLKGYWKCDETSGTILADSSGNSKNLTITGAINTNYWLGETGEQGTCLRTDGVAGYASRNDAVIPSLDNTNFTLFALFKGGTDFGSAAALAISNSSTGNDRTQIGEFSTSSQASAQARGHSTVMASGFSGGTAFDGSWHSVAFRRNATAFDLFVDGARVASTTATLATGSTCNRTTLMHILTSGTTAYAKGRIQHAAIWNRALSDSEIVAIQTARTVNPAPTPTPLPQRQLQQRRQRLDQRPQLRAHQRPQLRAHQLPQRLPTWFGPAKTGLQLLLSKWVWMGICSCKREPMRSTTGQGGGSGMIVRRGRVVLSWGSMSTPVRPCIHYQIDWFSGAWFASQRRPWSNQDHR